MPITLQHFAQSKQAQRPITALTAWDYSIAQILDASGVDLILVGDSLAMVALGYDTTLPVTLDEMLHHTKAVRRGVNHAFVVMDLPFMSYQESWQQAMHSAGRALKEAGAQAVKLEGGYPAMADTVARLVQAGIPVMGHVGLTPQSVRQLGFRQQGKTAIAADSVLQEAIALEQAGAFAIVLEHIPAALAKTITDRISIPTIGIGAGVHCDGQVLVTTDMLGMGVWKPPFAKAYADVRSVMIEATQAYCAQVQGRDFPEL